MGSSDVGVQTVPLTIEQRNWLRVNAILPPLFAAPILGIVALAITFIYRRFGDALPVKIFAGLGALLVIAVFLAVLLHVRNSASDAMRGVAHVATARLLAKRETGRSPKTLNAEFEGIGNTIALIDVYAPLVVGRMYRIAYSPRTRRLWSAS